MSNQQKKTQLSESLMTGGRSHALPPVSVNTKAVNGQHYTQLAKTENTPISTTNSSQKSLNLTESERENALLAAGILASTVPTLLKAGLLRRARNQVTGEALLVFPSTVWTDELKLKNKEK